LVALLLAFSFSATSNRYDMRQRLVLALVPYVVLDFDRPRRGVILVDQTPLVELQESLRNP